MFGLRSSVSLCLPGSWGRQARNRVNVSVRRMMGSDYGDLGQFMGRASQGLQMLFQEVNWGGGRMSPRTAPGGET